ncbi:T cell receptor beta chain MC.7.G5-like isoform X2 [Triplophysa rosa]|uniref:T cell receptor beta chain MC.7.G5-like isoform X2 n=1 Tax=Triplophysa rosa TaxID=992332 RepID=UPI0025463139|nr:T cell receptor beta chain MC.7.G5-like isoform X2 [Triplophysa rosa]
MRCDTGGYQAYFGNGTKLTVLDRDIPISRPEVKILKPSKKELCKKSVTLVCVAENFYPDHVTIKWKIGSKEVAKGVATDQYATPKSNKKFYISSRLKVHKKDWNKAKNKFTCIVTFFNDTYTDFTVTVNGIVGAGGFDRDEHVTKAQTVKLAYGVFIAKSGLYGLFILLFIWRQGSASKQ